MKREHLGRRTRILGIDFFNGTVEEAVQCGLGGGLVVVPSAPVLVELDSSCEQRKALTEADLAITDSGLMILVWRLLGGESIQRVSGLEYISHVLKVPSLRESGAVAWIMPSSVAMDRNLLWLQAAGIKHSVQDCYVAPMYPKGEIEDIELLRWLEERRPSQVILALGGGTQERLGLYLRDRISFCAGIHCIGAAIGFLSGDQVRIPMWADHLYLGWLVRCFSSPSRYVPRYWKAFRLISMMVRFRDRLPPMNRD
jgi:N-acetylglucosaminyldiphosphoundecaprenol N-acetyl-beta-D-mannosaminyltransferase